MGLFKKKESIPEIPPVLRLPELPKIEKSEIPVPPQQPVQTPVPIMPSISSSQLSTTTPEFPSMSSKAQALPSLPKSRFNERLNQDIVKSAVSDSSEEKEVEIEELPRDFKFEQMERAGKEEMIPSVLNTETVMKKMSEEKAPEKRAAPIISRPKQISESEPVFVRIENFQESEKRFNEIKKKVREIENALNKVKEVKIKEDEEISRWTEDLGKIKSKLNEIDSDIFSKI